MYNEAKEKYTKLGVDTDAAIAKLKTVPVALHCWQGDDVRGFDTNPSKPLTGGIQTTDNYPGRARTPEELMADLDMVLKLCPGMKKMNLHASYAIFEDGEWADRDKLEPKHFKKWVDFCKERGLGFGFNPTFFSYPMCDPLTTVFFIMENIKKAGNTVSTMGEAAKQFIANWESEKYRKSLAAK